jgi:hypothetical protein
MGGAHSMNAQHSTSLHIVCQLRKVLFQYVDDSYWIIIFFVIYLDPFRVEKIGGINLQGHLSGRSQFGKLGFVTFQGNFEASKDIFWGQLFPT